MLYTDPIPREDNNNVRVRRNSDNSVNSDNWTEVIVSDTEPTITSITHSYRLVLATVKPLFCEFLLLFFLH